MLTRRRWLGGAMTTAGLVLAPIKVTRFTDAEAATTVRTIAGYGPVYPLTRSWIRSSWFDGWRWQVGTLAQLDRMYRGVYNLPSTQVPPSDRLAILARVVNTEGWDKAVSLLCRVPEFLNPGTHTVVSLYRNPTKSPSHMEVALERANQIRKLYKAFLNRAPTGPELGDTLLSFVRFNPTVQLLSLGLTPNRSHAQVSSMGLTNYVTAPPLVGAPPLNPPPLTTVTNSATLSQGEISQILNYLLQQQDPKAALQQLKAGAPLVPVNQAPTSIVPPPVVLSAAEMALFGGEDAEKVKRELNLRGVTTTNQTVVLVALGAAFKLLRVASEPVKVGLQLLAAGLVTGTIGVRVVTTATAITVVWVGIVPVILGGLVIYTILKNTGWSLELGVMPDANVPVANPDLNPDAGRPYLWTPGTE